MKTIHLMAALAVACFALVVPQAAMAADLIGHVAHSFNADALVGMIALGGMLGPMTANELKRGRYLRDGGGHPELTPEQKAAQIKAQFEAKHDAVKAIAEKALAEAEAGKSLSSTTKELADQAIAGMTEAKARLDELEQKMTVQREVETAVKSLGEFVTDDEGIKSFLASGLSKGRAGVEVKAIISALTTVANGSAGDLIVPDRIDGVVGVPLRRLTVRDLLTQGRTDKNSIQFIQETGFTNSAATVSETAGTTKAQSEI